jgi:hypothetical protein
VVTTTSSANVRQRQHQHQQQEEKEEDASISVEVSTTSRTHLVAAAVVCRYRKEEAWKATLPRYVPKLPYRYHDTYPIRRYADMVSVKYQENTTIKINKINPDT